MKAAVLRKGEVVTRDDVPVPTPGPGQVLARVLACGICGSDLHFAKHAPEFMQLAEEMVDAPRLTSRSLDLDCDVFMGHEFSAEVLELGPETEGPKPGTVVTSIPAVLTEQGYLTLAYTNELPCGYSEQLLLWAPWLLEVPNGLDPLHAALTEPMAVAYHAVAQSGITPGDAAVVVGCGPVGLAIIAVLRGKGFSPVVAADFSQKRRQLASALGADIVVDPAEASAIGTHRDLHGRQPVVIFEAVGSPGILNAIIREAPRGSRVLVAGVCMQPDTLTPYYASGKELSLLFAFGYTADEYADTLRAIAEGEVDVAPFITGVVDLDGVPDAFDQLAVPNEHAKILVVPGS